MFKVMVLKFETFWYSMNILYSIQRDMLRIYITDGISRIDKVKAMVHHGPPFTFSSTRLINREDESVIVGQKRSLNLCARGESSPRTRATGGEDLQTSETRRKYMSRC